MKNLKIMLLTLLLASSFVQAENQYEVNCSVLQRYPVYLPEQPYEIGIMPDDGWYNAGFHGASKDEPGGEGWGLNIEIQRGDLSTDGYLFGAIFAPDENGNPIYRIFNGPITLGEPGAWRTNKPTASFEGQMTLVNGGRCIECTENIPGESVPAPEGNIKITWRDNRHAIVKLGKRFIKIAHWQWADNIGVNKTDWIKGNWIVSGDIRRNKNGTTNRRTQTIMTVTSENRVPQGLIGKGWVVYQGLLDLVKVTVPGESPALGKGAQFSAEYYILYKPQFDTWEMINKSALSPSDPGGPFPTYEEADWLPIRLFIQGQNKMVGLGFEDPAGTQSEATILGTSIMLHRVDSNIAKEALFLPLPHEAFGCP